MNDVGSAIARTLDPRVALVLCVLGCGSPPQAAAPVTKATGPTSAESAPAPPATEPAAPAAGAAPTTGAAPATAAAARAELVIKAIDVYGTTRIDAAWAKDRFGERIQRMLETEEDGEGKRLQNEIIEEIRAAHPQIGWVKLSFIGDFKAGGQEGHLTIDVVEKADMKSRLRFRAAPTGDVEDPAGLIAAWNEYEETYFAMMQSGEISPARVACPAFHCVAGYEHEKLRAFGERFVRDVPANEAKLVRVLRQDKDDEERGAAAYLLAHIKDGKKLVALMLPVLDDPGSLARNNATRVLGDIAHFHPAVPVPLAPVLRALDGPTTTDRNKAAVVVAGLVGRPDGAKLHRQIIKQAGATLIKLLALEQPNNHDFAYIILKKVSGKDLGERDIEAWRRWLASQR